MDLHSLFPCQKDWFFTPSIFFRWVEPTNQNFVFVEWSALFEKIWVTIQEKEAPKEEAKPPEDPVILYAQATLNQHSWLENGPGLKEDVYISY